MADRARAVPAGPLAGRHMGLVLATSTGGTGRHVRALAAALRESGAGVTVCGPHGTEGTFGFTAVGARFRPVEIAAGIRPLADLRALGALRRGLAGADLVHAHGLRAGLLAGLVDGLVLRPPTRRARPYVVTWHNAVLAAGPLRPAYALAERAVARRADVTLAVSADLERRVRLLGGRDVRPGPVGAPPLRPPRGEPSRLRAALGAAGRPVLLAVARLHPQKGLDTLVAAAAALRGRDPVPLVLVAGGGPAYRRLARQVAESGAPVRLLGPRDDVADLLALADVVVLPSRWEGSPLVVQEALRAGRPLVATAVGGVPALVGDAALLIPPDDPAALAAALARLLDDPSYATRLTSRAGLVAGRLPTEAATAAAVLAVYAELLGG